MRTILLLILMLALAAPAVARVAEVPASDAEIKKLVDQLGSGDYAQREAASKKLKAIGKPALPALKEAMTDGVDAEIVSRAQVLVKRIEVRPVPGPDPAFMKNGGAFATRINLSVVNGNRVIDVNEAGREIRLSDGADGISMTVTGLLDGQRTTEEFTAKDAAQLREENPEAYALYEHWVDSTPGFILRGPARFNGQMQLRGIAAIPNVPDELTQLREHLEKQMKTAKLKDDQRGEVIKALDELVDARNKGLETGMEKYTEQCDDFRKTLAQYKLDPGEFLPPPAKTRLGVSIQSAVNGPMVVQTVAEKSRAERLGLQQGDEIRKINGKAVANIAELRKAVSESEKGLKMEVVRDGDKMTLEEKEEKKKEE